MTMDFVADHTFRSDGAGMCHGLSGDYMEFTC